MWRMRIQSIPGPSSVRPGIEANLVIEYEFTGVQRVSDLGLNFSHRITRVLLWETRHACMIVKVVQQMLLQTWLISHGINIHI